MAKTVGDLLVERLIEWGVDTIFGLPGDGINGVFEALRTASDRIRFIQVRHEETAAFAACGYAKFSGRLGACIATSGPGGIHLLNGLYDAKLDGAPVLAITGHTFHDLIGTHYQQDVDLDKLYMDVAVYNERIMGPAHVVNVVDEAVRCALARRGVAHITIPKDVQSWPLYEDKRSKANPPQHSADLFAAPHPLPPTPALQHAADIINNGTRVAILVGQGALGCVDELTTLAEKVGGPIIKALLGKAVVPDDSPYTTGGIGLLGTAPSQDAMQNCDTLIIVGSSFPYHEFYPKRGKANGVQIDSDPARIGLRYPVEVGLVGRARDVLHALLPLIEHKEKRDFIETAQKNMADWRSLISERGKRSDVPMKPQVVAYQLNSLLDDDAIVIADSGTVATWAARHIDMRGRMMFSLSGTLASMANGLPYAIGAALAFPDRQVVALVGDGACSMLMGDLATLAKYHLPVKVVVVKNNVLGQIKWEQIVFEGNPQFGVELHPIDFATVAGACGVTGFSVDRPENVAPALRQALAHDGPAIVEALVDAHEPPMPGNVTTEQMIKFSEAILKGQRQGFEIIKTIIGDKVREIV